MKLLELRKNLKQEFVQLDLDAVDVDFIISEVLNVKRTDLILIDEISESQHSEIMSKVELRKQNVPVEKIFGKAYFYGLEFKVNTFVLSPRPETELLVDKAIEYIKQNNFKTALDLCTGSGCIAISVKKNTGIELTATDISIRALQVAKQNAKTNDVEINFIQSDMFDNIDGKFDIIISNPPYIDTNEIGLLDEEVKKYDPKIALDGGDLGLKFYNIIHDNLRKHLNDGGMLLMEIGEDQKDLIVSLFNDFNLVEEIQDYCGNDRILIFNKGGK